MHPNLAPLKTNEKIVFNNLQDKRRKHKHRCQLGQIVRTADIKNFY